MNSRDYFNLLATVNNAMSASVQKPQDPPFSSFGYISRNEITESYGSSVFRETSKLCSIKPMTIFLSQNA